MDEKRVRKLQRARRRAAAMGDLDAYAALTKQLDQLYSRVFHNCHGASQT